MPVRFSSAPFCIALACALSGCPFGVEAELAVSGNAELLNGLEPPIDGSSVYFFVMRPEKDASEFCRFDGIGQLSFETALSSRPEPAVFPRSFNFGGIGAAAPEQLMKVIGWVPTATMTLGRRPDRRIQPGDYYGESAVFELSGSGTGRAPGLMVTFDLMAESPCGGG